MPNTHIGFLFFQSWAFKQSSHGLSRAVLVSVLPQSLPRGHTKTQKSPLPCSYFILKFFRHHLFLPSRETVLKAWYKLVLFLPMQLLFFFLY